MEIVATVKDIQPNGPKPTLELAFQRRDSASASAQMLVLTRRAWEEDIRSLSRASRVDRLPRVTEGGGSLAAWKSLPMLQN